MECDIENAKYEEIVEIRYMEEKNVEIEFTPLLSGEYLHSLVFRGDKNNFFWYLLKIEVESPEPIKAFHYKT